MASDALPLEPDEFRRWQRTALIAGGTGLLLCALTWFLWPASFYRLYLWGYLYILGITLGCLVLVLLQFLTGGAWGLVLRRLFEAVTRTLPVMALLYLPLAVGFFLPAAHDESSADHGAKRAISSLYVWADPAFFHHATPDMAFKRWYLSPGRFLVSAAIYFGVWLGVAIFLNRWSPATDRPDAGDPRHLRRLGAAGLVLYAVTITLASIDWVMSLEPNWVSSIFGALFGMGQVLSAMSFAVIALVCLSDRPPLAGVIGRPILRDLGSLLLAFVMVWAYMAFSQFLLIWSGNLPGEIPYYLRRFQGGWQWMAVLLLLFHFALPFVLLLSRDVKRNGRTLLAVAALVLAMRAVDLFWLIVPAQPGLDGKSAVDFRLGFGDLLALVGALAGVGGVWMAVFLGQLQRRRILPEHDPLLAEALHHE